VDEAAGDLEERLHEALTAEDADALVEIGCDLADLDRQREALLCFRRAVALGREWVWFNVGNTLRELGRPLEAVEAYERAVAAGESDAWLNLGHVLEQQGDLAGAGRAFRAAWETGGQPEGCVDLALLLREQGLREDAEAALVPAAEHGHPPAAALLTCWRWERTRDPALEGALRAAAVVSGDARADLADLLLATGRRRQARDQLELGAKLGQHECWLPLGNLLHDDAGTGGGEVDPAEEAAAEDAYRAGIAAGDTHCHHNLAVLLLQRGDVRGAEEHLLAGTAAGDDLARRAWRDLHPEED
jgi:tetratricopeptide (TPR) repeat protein